MLSPFWDAAAAAAWKRGRGYFAVALLLWGAALVGGRMTTGQAISAVAAGVPLWALYFALGFRAFARGAQASGLGMLLTVGLPLAAYVLARLGWPLACSWLPPGTVHGAGALTPPGLAGPVLVAALTLVLSRDALRHCEARLRAWYDRNHGAKVMT